MVLQIVQKEYLHKKSGIEMKKSFVFAFILICCCIFSSCEKAHAPSNVEEAIYATGYSTTQEDNSQTISEIQQEAYSKGYRAGYEAGEEDDDNYQEGFSKGYDAGRDEWHDEAWVDGYLAAYEEMEMDPPENYMEEHHIDFEKYYFDYYF